MKIISSKMTMLVVFLVFLVAIVIFNFLDLTRDFTSSREYSHHEIESMQFYYVNINTADLDELSELPCVSNSQAKAIIEYREENGDFESIEEILNVNGIGEKTFDEIKMNITV